MTAASRPRVAPRLAAVLTGLLGAALAVSAVTAVARAVGALRVAVLGQTVGPTCLGDTYTTANTVPNVVFEVVAGGALASLVVPVLARSVATGDRDAVDRTASALLTWTVLLLAPVALLVAAASRPLMAALLGEPAAGCDAVDQVAVGARMLVVFAPQVVLYGIGLVLAGVLQAHRRFLGPAVAPLLSSLVVVTAYLAYGAQAGQDAVPLGELSQAEELTLSVGTTLGVLVLSLSLLVPLRRVGLRLTPTLAFPPGVARRVRGLAGAGVVVLVAQQVSVLVALRLLNAGAPAGSVVLFALATTVFLVPWGVLAVPVATSAFPRMAEQADAGDSRAYAGTVAAATRVVLAVSVASATLLVVAAEPVARLLLASGPGRGSADALADALVAFAPGLVGYGLVAVLGRALYAAGAGRAAAAATGAGWVAVAVADVALVAALPPADAVTAVGLGNTTGMTVAGAALLVAVARTVGGAALAGLGRTGLVAAVAAGVGLAAGRGAVELVAVPGVAGALLACAAAGLVVLAVLAAAVAVAEPASARRVAGRVRRGAGGRRRSATGPSGREDVAP